MYWKSNILQDALAKLYKHLSLRTKKWRSFNIILYYDFTTATKQKKIDRTIHESGS